eukprot:scaffold6055_cov242-Prasinococcus_capsulatus_cf.AAC.1
MPTYKFDEGDTDMYDTSSKARIPSWTDRVQWRCDPVCPQRVRLVQYSSLPHVRYSDHRPVVALFNITSYASIDWRANDRPCAERGNGPHAKPARGGACLIQ